MGFFLSASLSFLALTVVHLPTKAGTAAAMGAEAAEIESGCRFTLPVYLPLNQSGGCLGGLSGRRVGRVVLLVHHSGILGRRVAVEAFYKRTLYFGVLERPSEITLRWFGSGSKKSLAERRTDDFLGVAEAFRSALADFPLAKWFIKLDDDAALFVGNLLRILEQIEHDHVIMCGPTPDLPFYGGVSMNVDLTRLKRHNAQRDQSDVLANCPDSLNYASGGAGYLLSRAALLKITETGCLSRSGISHYEDVSMGLCAFYASVELTPMLGMWPYTEDILRCCIEHRSKPATICGLDCTRSLHSSYDPSTMAPLTRHYLPPAHIRMLDVEAGFTSISSRALSDFDLYAELHAHNTAGVRFGRFNPLVYGLRPKVVLYMPDPEAPLSTRIIGILNSFLLALVTGRGFIVDWRHEFKIPGDSSRQDPSNLGRKLRDILLPPSSLMEDWDVPLRFDEVVHWIVPRFAQSNKQAVGPKWVWNEENHTQNMWSDSLAMGDLDMVFPEAVLVARGESVSSFSQYLAMNPLYASRLSRDFGANHLLKNLAKVLLVPSPATLQHKESILQHAQGVFHLRQVQHSSPSLVLGLFQRTAQLCGVRSFYRSDADALVFENWKLVAGDSKSSQVTPTDRSALDSAVALNNGDVSMLGSILALAECEDAIISLRDDIGQVAIILRPVGKPSARLFDDIRDTCTIARTDTDSEPSARSSVASINYQRTSAICTPLQALAAPKWHMQSDAERSFSRFYVDHLNSSASLGNPSSTSKPATSISKQIRVYLVHSMDGRIGNELFKWASVRGIALSNKMEACFLNSTQFDPVFDTIPDPCVRKPPLRRISEESQFGTHLDFNLKMCVDCGEDILLTGWLQSYRYFPTGIRSELHFRPALLANASKYLQAFRAWNRVLVGIHVRYEHQFEVKSSYLRFPPTSYFEDAMRYFRLRYSNTHFVVASDNPEWCAHQHFFQAADVTVVTEVHTSGLDFAILAACDHMIISVGTFGWWVAYIGADARGGEVVYYADEFDMDHVEIRGKVVHQHYYPENWHAMGERTITTNTSPFIPIPTGVVTLVTAYHPIPSKHSSADYDLWISNFLTLRENMVIFTSSEGEAAIATQRSHARNHTRIIVAPLEQSKMLSDFNSSFWKGQLSSDPESNLHKDFRLYVIWNEKAHWLKLAVDLNVWPNSTFFAWVDIGYFRTTYFNGQAMIQYLPASLRQDQVMLLDLTRLARELHTGGSIVGGGFIGGYAPGIRRWHQAYYEILSEHRRGFIGKDQPWMLHTCNKHVLSAGGSLCYMVQLTTNDLSRHGDPWFYMAPFTHFGSTVARSVVVGCKDCSLQKNTAHRKNHTGPRHLYHRHPSPGHPGPGHTGSGHPSPWYPSPGHAGPGHPSSGYHTGPGHPSPGNP